MKTQYIIPKMIRSIPFLAASLMIAVVLFVPLASRAQSICVVTSINDAGPDTLRQCLQDVVTGDSISFDTSVFPPGSPVTIMLNSELPQLNQGNISIDASNAGVILDGSGLSNEPGLRIQSDGNQIIGLQWLNFPNDVIFVQGKNNLIGGDRSLGSGPLGQGNLFGNNAGVTIVIQGTGTMSNTISGNYIGVGLDGSTALPNYGGIRVEGGAQYNRIGGDTPGESNVIAGNTWRGISINGVGDIYPQDPLLDDVSLTFDGSANLLANSGFDSDTLHWVTADDDPAFGRSLNTGDYHSSPASYQFNRNAAWGVMRSFYDTAAQTGSIPDPYQASSSIWITVTPGTQVELSYWYNLGFGTAFILGRDTGGGWRNLEVLDCNCMVTDWTYAAFTAKIPGDIDAIGIQFDMRINEQTAHNIVSGNYIGTDASGQNPLPNQEDGIRLESGTVDNLIGGPDQAARNIIFSNGFAGVRIMNPATTGNIIQGNYLGFGLGGIRQAYPVDMAMSPNFATDCTLYVATQSTGIHKTTDCGATWNEVNQGLTESRFMIVKIPPDAANANRVYALAETGALFITQDGGANWSLVSTVLQGIDRRNLALSANFNVDQTLYASAENWSWQELGDGPGVFKSTDGGVTWARVDNGMSDKRIWKVLASPSAASAGTLFALGYDVIYKSTDGGANWSSLASPDSNLTDLALSPNFGSDQTMFATAWGNNNGRVYRSTDGGANWTGFDTPRGDPRFIAISPAYASDQTVCHGGGWNDWSYCSSDGGLTWNQRFSGLPGGLNSGATGILFTPNYATTHTLYMISPSGISRSTDRAETWIVLNSLHPVGNGQGVVVEDRAHQNTIGPDNVISNNASGIEIHWDASDNTITGNQIGTWPGGLSALPNIQDGVQINGSYNTITDNLISGNLVEGVRINGESAFENVVAGNLLGTDITGNQVLGNGGAGVSLHSGAHHNLVGGHTPAERNLISGNGYAMGLWDWNTAYNTISGNYVGVNAAGTAGLYSGSGIQINRGANHNLIGGLTPEEGNLISGNKWHGVQITDGGTFSNTVSANIIGLDAGGTYAIPNGGSGVWVENGPEYTVIGGDTPGERNIISGNGIGENWDRVGVFIGGQGTAYTLVQGNYIGLDISGAHPLGNLGHGVELWVGTHDNQIRDNVISANGWEGILALNETPNNLIDGNYIGLNAAGTTALGNRRNGIYFGEGGWDNRSPRDNTISNNVISGNGFSDGGYSGIVIDGGSASGNLIFGNKIGTDPSGTIPLPNAFILAEAQQDSLEISDFDSALPNPTSLSGSTTPNSLISQASQMQILDVQRDPSAISAPSGSPNANAQNGVTFYNGAHNNTVGPNNVIAFNGWHGVEVNGSSAGNTITQNSIFRNTQQGIALADGGNHNLMSPRITSSSLVGGTASGTACANCTIEIFSTTDEEGQTFEGSTVADVNGAWAFNAGHALVGPNLTATATSAEGDTSAFSQLFNLLVFDLNVPQDLNALNRLGLQYDLVNGAAFASVDLSNYDVLFVGFTGNDPQPDDLLQPLLDRQADIAAFVQAGGALVANSEDGVVATPLDWLWVPVPVTHRNSNNQQMLINLPTHLLMEGLTESDLNGWWPYHNTFTTWDWPEAEVVLTEPGSGEAIILAGSYGSGRMIFSGSDPDYHGEEGAAKLLSNEIYWAAGVLTDQPPFVAWHRPANAEGTSANTLVDAYFDQMIDPATVTAANFKVVGSQSGAVSGALDYDNYFGVATFTPDTPFSVGETVTVTVSGNIQDLTGNGLDGNGDQISQGSPIDDYVWTFTIRDPHTLVVNSTGDDGMWNYVEGQLTLRQAMETCQAGDTITFDPVVFPPASPTTIFVENGEYNAMWPGYVTIDASNAGVILNGSRLGGGNAFNIVSDGNAIRGLQILSFPDQAINFMWRSQHNVIGGSNATPGGVCSGQCNLISGNGASAINLNGLGVRNNLVSGNYIGTDRSGNTAISNNLRYGVNAIDISDGASYNRIGGDTPGERNLVSGNHYGIVINYANYNEVVGNYLGVNAAGTAALGNRAAGTGVGGGHHNTFRNNLISGNDWVGLYLHNWGADYNVVIGNRIGTDASGSGAIPNGSGIELNNDARNNRIGGITPAEHNVIAFNNGDGIAVYGGGSWANTFQQNSIYANSGQGIALWWIDALPQPVVVTASPAGTASGTAPANCTIEIFSDNDDEGRWYEGTTTSDGSGNWSFNKGSAFNGPNIHATATDADGNTSEFSGPGPIIDGLWPPSANPGSNNLVFWLWGSNFRENPPLGVDFGAGMDVTKIEFVHSGLLKLYVNIAPDAAYGLRDATVTINDGQSFTLSSVFEVVSELPPPPVVTGVDPNQAAPGTSSEFFIFGSNFINQPQVSVSGGDVGVNWVDFQSDKKLWVSFSVNAGATFGPRDVTVTNPEGQSFTLTNAFVIAPPIFEDVAPSFGLNLHTGEDGAAWGDWNDDGWLDLAFGSNFLFTNNAAASFTDETVNAGLEWNDQYSGWAWGDYNNDGKLDLLSSWRKVYRQNSLPFSKVLDGGGNHPPLAWADFDRDGDLDAYADGILYRNDGSDIFTDVTGAAGINPSGYLLSATWADTDNDLWPDLYITNNSGNDYLYHNNGNGTFSDVTSAAGINNGGSGHGATWGDYDNDGDLDLFVANNNNEYSVLFRNNGDGTFTNVSEAAGLHDRQGNGTGANWLDYDLDGWLDVFVVNRDDRNRLYHNNGNGTFTDYGSAIGAAYNQDSDGSAVGDYDNDGDPDIFVVSGTWNWSNTPSRLLQNNLDHTNRHWLKVRLEGILSNHTGIGARVVVYTDGPLQTRLIAGSTGYMSQDAPEALFGLGNYTGIVGVIVYWPSGVMDVRNVAVDQTIVIAESTPYFHDLGLTSVLPAGERPINIAFQPFVTLRNYGQSADGAPVTCRIVHNSAQVYAQTLNTGLLPPANWKSLTLPAFTPTETGNYQLTCQVALPGDERTSNDILVQNISVTEQVTDVWSKDDPYDDGDVPSSLNNWYMSPDLWVRNADDGGLIPQDPIKGITNTVYVRLRNRGNTTITTGDVNVYWIEPSLGVRCGGWAEIGVVNFTNLLPGEQRILKLPWVPSRSGHTCLQDVINSPQDPYAAALECTPQWVPWDNNVSWHNVNILANSVTLGNSPMDIKESAVQLVNVYEVPKDVDVIVDRLSFPADGVITVRLPVGLFNRWLDYGKNWGEGIEVLTTTHEIRITDAISATIGAIPMMADEVVTVGLEFSGPAGLEFEMGIRERIDGITMGGVSYQWMIPDTTPPTIISVEPVNDAVNVLLDAPLVITFNEPVSPLTLELSVDPDPGMWSYEWNDDNTVVTVTHAAFTPDTTYQFSFRVSDVSGNAVLAPYQWEFTTLSEEFYLYLPIVIRQ